MSNEKFLEQLQKSRNLKILELLEKSLINAKDEEECTEKENTMYADMSNLIDSIKNNYYE